MGKFPPHFFGASIKKPIAKMYQSISLVSQGRSLPPLYLSPFGSFLHFFFFFVNVTFCSNITT